MLTPQNACIVTKCSRWPLLIDPQLQGIAWLRVREEMNPNATLKVITHNDPKLVVHLEHAVRNGGPCCTSPG